MTLPWLKPRGFYIHRLTDNPLPHSALTSPTLFPTRNTTTRKQAQQHFKLRTKNPTQHTATWCASYSTLHSALFPPPPHLPIPPPSSPLSTQHSALSTHLLRSPTLLNRM
uniref:Uncharacterized protein n=1 Tax=Desertifilum tharense IPPAS B-1220 TaxID=1781255 RepID=A0ACD5H125_9CYAN